MVESLYNVHKLRDVLLQYNQHLKYYNERNDPINFVIDNPLRRYNDGIDEYYEFLLDNLNILKNILTKIDDITEQMTDINLGTIPSNELLDVYINHNICALSVIICGASFITNYCYFICRKCGLQDCLNKKYKKDYVYIDELATVNNRCLYEIYEAVKNKPFLKDTAEAFYKSQIDKINVADDINLIEKDLGHSLIHDMFLLMLENIIMTENGFNCIKVTRKNKKLYYAFYIEYKSIIAKAKQLYEMVKSEKHVKTPKIFFDMRELLG